MSSAPRDNDSRPTYAPGRLILGTVQFGMPYGIANQTGRVTAENALAVLARARSAGLHTLDTAIAYGDSERLLGVECAGQWHVISKLPKMLDATAEVDAWVRDSVHGSLERLRVTRLRGLLLHHPAQLLSPSGDALYAAMVAVREQGLVDSIGISVYGPDELDLLCRRFHFDMVQAPFNILDRRLQQSGWLDELTRTGTQVHARSVFLQGLLLMAASQRPAAFNRWASLWRCWERWLAAAAITPLQACVSFALSQSQLHSVVVGADSVAQLEQILFCCKEARTLQFPEELMSTDLDLINPSRWKST